MSKWSVSDSTTALADSTVGFTVGELLVETLAAAAVVVEAAAELKAGAFVAAVEAVAAADPASAAAVSGTSGFISTSNPRFCASITNIRCACSDRMRPATATYVCGPLSAWMVVSSGTMSSSMYVTSDATIPSNGTSERKAARSESSPQNSLALRMVGVAAVAVAVAEAGEEVEEAEEGAGADEAGTLSTTTSRA